MGKRIGCTLINGKGHIVDQIFNELSVSACYPNAFAAQAGMDVAIDVSLSLAALGMSKIIRTTSDFTTRFLSNGYTVAEWALEKNGNKEKKIYFLTYATKSPYIENFFEERDQDEELIEFLYGQEIALGLGLAYLWGGFSISLHGDLRFIEEKINLSEYKVTGIEENTNDVSVLTFSNTKQVRLHKDIIQQCIFSTINSGSDLIKNSKEILPFLSLGQKAIDQIECFRGSEQFFPEVLHHLYTLNNGMRELKGGAFNPNIDYSTESGSTMRNREYAQKRSFRCNDNVVRQFRLHSKIKSANKRIYFFPIPEQRVVHIGYVGDHLPTTKFPT